MGAVLAPARSLLSLASLAVLLAEYRIVQLGFYLVGGGPDLPELVRLLFQLWLLLWLWSLLLWFWASLVQCLLPLLLAAAVLVAVVQVVADVVVVLVVVIVVAFL